MLLGLGDGVVFTGYLLVIASTVLCLVYGIMNWNKGSDPSVSELEKEKKWRQEEIEIDDEVSEGGQV